MSALLPPPPRSLFVALFHSPVRPSRILGYKVSEGVPVQGQHIGSCFPLDPDPEITVDPRLSDRLWYATALHEIAHCRGKTYQHGYRFARSLNAVWREAEGITPIPAYFFSVVGRQFLSRPVILGCELLGVTKIPRIPRE